MRPTEVVRATTVAVWLEGIPPVVISIYLSNFSLWNRHRIIGLSSCAVSHATKEHNKGMFFRKMNLFTEDMLLDS